MSILKRVFKKLGASIYMLITDFYFNTNKASIIAITSPRLAQNVGVVSGLMFPVPYLEK